MQMPTNKILLDARLKIEQAMQNACDEIATQGGEIDDLAIFRYLVAGRTVTLNLVEPD